MPRNKAIDLKNHLFEQLERINDESLNQTELAVELERTDAVVKISSQLIKLEALALKSVELQIKSEELGFTTSVPELDLKD